MRADEEGTGHVVQYENVVETEPHLDDEKAGNTGGTEDDERNDTKVSSVPAECSTPWPLAPGVVALAAVAVTAIALSIRAIRNRRGRTEKFKSKIARCLMVDVDEVLVSGTVEVASAGAQFPLRIVSSDDLPSMRWIDDRNFKAVGTSVTPSSSIAEVKQQLHAVCRQLLRRSIAWCGLANPTGVAAVELDLADCTCFVHKGGSYSPWSSIVARGLFGYRCTSGLYAKDIVLASREGSSLLRCGNALVQGSDQRSAQDDSPKRYLVAEDVFSVCEEAMSSVTPSVIEGVKRWAGAEQAQSLSLCQWLFHRVSGIRRFVEGPDAAGSQGKPSAGDILDALVRISNILHDGMDVGVAEDGRKEDGKDGEMDQTVGTSQGPGRSVSAVTAEDLIHARLVAEELSMACYSAMDEGLVFVVPTSPGVPPRMDAEDAELVAWEAAVTRLNSLSTLAGIPQVSIPVPIRPTKSPASSPLSFVGISLLTRQRKDLVILRSLEKLHGFIENDVNKRAGDKGSHEDSPFDVEAEKALGNECFRSKQYMLAIQHYSRCIAHDKTNPVYPSNRAMAHLKMGAYEDAEQDCNLALGIDPCNVKALLRRGAARAGLESYQEAAEDYSRVLAIEPGNLQAKEQLLRLRKVLG